MNEAQHFVDHIVECVGEVVALTDVRIGLTGWTDVQHLQRVVSLRVDGTALCMYEDDLEVQRPAAGKTRIERPLHEANLISSVVVDAVLFLSRGKAYRQLKRRGYFDRFKPYPPK
jgi:hypothetical protein